MSEIPLGSRSLTAEDAEKVLKANYLNCVRKAASGQTLSSVELGFIEAVRHRGGDGSIDVPAPTARFAKNQVELAEALGVNRKTIQRWLKRDGHPGTRPDGRYEIPLWKTWARTQGHVFEDAEPVDKKAAEVKILLQRSELLQIEIDKERDRLMPVEEVRGAFGRMIGEFRVALYSIPGSLAPQVVGLTVPEAEKRLRHALDDAMTLVAEDKVGLKADAPG